MEKTIGEIKAQKLFQWQNVKPLSVFQVILSFLIPSAIATTLFHIVLPKLVSMGWSPIIAWPFVASVGLALLVIFALWVLNHEAKQLNVTLSERMLFVSINWKQWLFYLGVLMLGLLVGTLSYQWLLPLMKLTNVSVPAYYPFWLNPVIDPTSINPEEPLQGMVLHGAYWFLPLFGIMLLLNILAEEFYFRAWLLPKMHRFGQWAWALNGFLFALYHVFQFWLLPVILLISLVMAWTVNQSKSIWPVLIIHLLLNFFGAGINLLLLIA